MRSGFLLSSLVAMMALGGTGRAAAQRVQVTPHEAQQRVDITVKGEPFTSYIWPETLTKPVLFPLRAADGTVVTRGYPLAPRPGERTDHPHHDGMWFDYSNVNGFDFWNNSSAIPASRKPKMGSIVQDKILLAKSGSKQGELDVEQEWVTGAGEAILDDTTRYIFSATADARVIDQITTLRALDTAVFHDDKDGLLGIRVASWLESPTAKGGTFTDASGKPTQVSATASPGASGVYLTSEGKRGDAAWGTRGRWCMLTGTTGSRTYTLAIVDHPENPGYPTYWHARGYGLFAANPLGRHMFDAKEPALNFTLEKGQAATFRYRVMVVTHGVTPEEMNREAGEFAKDYR